MSFFPAGFNRFDHTNLNELTAKATYKGQTFDVTLPDLNPHDKGVLSVPAQAWENGNSFLLEFFDAEGRLIDAEEIAIGNPVRPEYLNASGNLKLMVEDTDGYLKLKGKGFEIPFNKSTGLMENVTSHGEIVIQKGPFLNLDLNVNHLTGAEVRARSAQMGCGYLRRADGSGCFGHREGQTCNHLPRHRG